MKKNWKRLLSAGLVIALVITIINIIPRNNTMDVAHAAEVSNGVIRGTVSQLSDLPQYNNAANLEQPRGTVNHPFVILEIVPYEEYAEIGYLISGCEPVRIEDMFGDSLTSGVSSISVGKFTDDGESYFFLEEPESKKEYYDGGYEFKSGGDYAGYYELVASGGTFNYSYVKNKIEEPEETEEPSIPETDDADESDDEQSDGDQPGNNAPGESLPSSDEPEENHLGSDESGEGEPGSDEPINDQPDSDESSDEYGYNYGALVKTLDIGNTLTVSVDENGSQEPEPEPSQSAEPDIKEEPPVIDEPEVLPDEPEIEESEESEVEKSDEPEVSEPDIQEPIISVPDSEEPETDEDVTLIDGLMELAETQSEYTVTIERNNTKEGNLIWHTVTKSEREALEAAGVTFTDNIDEKLLENIGERVYTTRTATDSDQVIMVEHYYRYTHDDPFLKRSLNLTEEQAANYSIVVKTITPEQLNNALDWIDYADLIYLSPKKHVGVTTDVWIKYNDFYHQPTRTDGQYDDANNKSYLSDPMHDLSWDAALKIYYKVTADTNFAALIFDDNFFNGFPTDTYKRNVNITVYNWNFEPTQNIYGNQCEPFNTTGYNNNIYKLYVMLMCMDSNLFKQLYLNGDDPIVKDGVNRLQSGDAATYWCTETFMLAPDNIYPSPYSSLQNYWATVGWDSYHYGTTDTTTTRKDWCDGHLFTFNGSLNFTQFFEEGKLSTDKSKFTDFANALNGYMDDTSKASTAEAVRYILGDQPSSSYYGYGMTANILDLEPSVGLKSDGTPDWYLKESYVRMMLPHFKGNVKITHQTTAEFIGKIEDLNTTYDLIFMGLDYSAYNTTNRQIQIGNNWVNGNWPDWNDNSMDGKVYFHTGDSMVSAEHTPSTGRNRSVKWLLQSNGSTLNSTELRFPGNDISLLKESELFEFLKAGYPIVANSYLYDLPTQLIDSSTYIYDFIYKNREYANLLSTASPASVIEASVKNSLKSVVQFDSLPNQYNGRTDGEASPYVTAANYLPSNDLTFKFTVTPAGTEKYKYRIFVDQNRDSKFSDDEAVYTSTVVLDPEMAGQTFPKTYDYSYPIDSDWVGLIQWKIEVYEVRYVYDGNGNHVYDYQYGYDANGNYGVIGQTYAVTETGARYSATGQSAKRNTSGAKKQINVLQIMPKEIDYNNIYAGALDLSVEPRFTKYYDKLADYDISVDTITWAEFESYFYKTDALGNKVSRGFIYDYTKETDGKTNPVNLGEVGGNLDNYNMFIIGFGDTYGGINLSNDYGAIDYLRYYVDQGKSILFTHDLTSMYNVESTTFGYTVDALMRDLMGMNRYGSVSSQADNAGNALANKWICTNCGYVHQAANTPTKCPDCQATDFFVKFSTESSMLKTYQSANASLYDKTNSSAKHGYTYYTMKRLGWNNAADNSGGGVMPYRYTIVNPAGQYVLTDDKHGKTTGFNNSNDLTTKVSMVNEGQVTSYPYQIGEILTVAPTHGQWFALTPEDPEVTVWYALAGDPANINKSDNGNDGTSVTYAVSPNDAMNNYYIYSKGNIFYSGVGHSTVNGDMEAKLFINTMIAAYNAGYVPPSIVVTNDEAVMSGEQRYSIELMQNYDYGDIDAEGYYTQVVEDFNGEEYPVNFMPRDANLTKTDLECTIYYDIGGNDVIYVDRVVELSSRNGEPVRNADGSPKTLYANPTTHVFNNLENTKYYRIYYPKDYLSEPVHDIYFTIKNDRTNTTNITILNMNALPLFPLD